MYKRYVKRIFDFALSLIGLIALSWLIVIIAIAVKIDSKGPVFFKQNRLGLNGKKFVMYKFRSMCVGAEKYGVYSDNKDIRVTKIGKIIRKTSLDELPQLINVIKGDMSLIGPRPPLIYHPWKYEEYTDEQNRMFEVRPGITGWAQTHGRKEVEWNTRIKLNVWYVDHISFLIDLRIFCLTIFKVLSNEDNENKGETVIKKEDVMK